MILTIKQHGVGSVVIEGLFKLTFDNGKTYSTTHAEIFYPDNEEMYSVVMMADPISL